MIDLEIVSFSPEDNLSRYLSEIRKFPLLGRDQEVDLARRWRDSRDMDAGRLLAGSHLRLVAKIARGYRGYGLPVGDLISEGNVGLMQSLRKYDPDKGFRLATYAMWWIRAAIQEYILHSWSLVKTGTTAAQKKLFFNLRRLKAGMDAYEDGDLPSETVAAIAVELAVPEQDVVAMNRRLSSSGEMSLNVALKDGSDSEWQDLLVDETMDQETMIAEADELSWRRGLLEQSLDSLNARERHILSERRLREEPRTLEDLSREYGVSRERVRQIEVRAFEKLQSAMQSLALALQPKAAFA
ncbi:MAG: RNA polymerase sigma factor RpoH [Inquilinus sp.]|nr:RNA polymerase sigma factor RpoH [Inquilinus sp.]